MTVKIPYAANATVTQSGHERRPVSATTDVMVDPISTIKTTVAASQSQGRQRNDWPSRS